MFVDDSISSYCVVYDGYDISTIFSCFSRLVLKNLSKRNTKVV